MSQIEVKNLTLAYDGVPVLNDLGFSVNKGEYLCVVGENGSGKSTLIKAILGAVRPKTGTISFDKDGSKIGYLPQQTAAQKDFPASVREVVLSGLVSRSGFLPFYGKKEKAEALSNMKLLGIDDLADKCYRELSGGQQQRVLLARALSALGDILLLDEPVTGLDPAAAKEMYSAIYELNAKGITVIMVTHDVRSAVGFADKILHLSNSGAFFGTVEEYLASDVGAKYLKGGAI